MVMIMLIMIINMMVKCLHQDGFKQLDEQVVGEHVNGKRCFKTFSREVSEENHEN